MRTSTFSWGGHFRLWR